MTNPEAQNLINPAKNIYVIPGESQEAITAALALFYTLKDQGKNVNVLVDRIPDRLRFLTPSLDAVAYPKNFVISIPTTAAQISQVYYEKHPEALKIHLTVDQGALKKDSLACYYAEAKPDLVITLGVADYRQQLSGKLDSYAFLLEAPILNLDNKHENQKFGKINVVEDRPLSELVEEVAGPSSNRKAAEAILAGIVGETKNFTENVSAQTFESAAKAMRQGADLKEILKHFS